MSKHPFSIIQACLRCFADCFQIAHVNRMLFAEKCATIVMRYGKRTVKNTFNIVDHFSVDGLCVPFTCAPSFLCAPILRFLFCFCFNIPWKCTLKAFFLVATHQHTLCVRETSSVKTHKWRKLSLSLNNKKFCVLATQQHLEEEKKQKWKTLYVIGSVRETKIQIARECYSLIRILCCW